MSVFVSYAGRDRAWAEWVAWELRGAGCTVELALRDWKAGENFVEKMRDALDRAECMVALFSPAYFEPDRYTSAELTAVFADRGPARVRLVPVRVEAVVPPRLYRTLISVDLFAVPEETARRRLIEAVGGGARDARPAAAADDRPRLPGSWPAVWNVPARNAAFTGRDEMLNDLRAGLRTEQRVLVYALKGIGGIGKTTVALEYAHRFAGEYDLVWWVTAERPELVGEQLAVLAALVGAATPDDDVTTAAAAALAHLRTRDRALVVFDNVAVQEDLRGWLPGGAAQVLVTSRSPVWHEVARSISVDVFARPESVALLRAALPATTDRDADRLASALGDLPLAVAQAANLMAETGMTVDDYLAGLATHAGAALTAGPAPAGYPRSLAASVRLAAGLLATEEPAAEQLLTLCAYLAPEPIPLDLFTAATGLPEPLGDVSRDSLSLARVVGRITRYGLATASAGHLVVHRLTQAVLRDADADSGDGRRAFIGSLLVAARPDGGDQPATWPRWGRLMPHILAADPAGSDDPALRRLAYFMVWHLLVRGDERAVLSLAEPLREAWAARLGPGDDSTLMANDLVAWAYRQLDRYADARRVDADTLERTRAAKGEDHPHTLASTSNLAIDLHGLSEYGESRRLNEDVLARSRRTLGPDHPSTLNCANNLARDLAALGDHEAARALSEDTLARFRRVLGDDHPSTLTSANGLAANLSALGEHERARALDEDTYARTRLVLGDDHPDTLLSASNLAEDLRCLGDHEGARRLDEDTYERRRRVLGDGNPRTRTSAENLLADLRALGEQERSRDLEREIARLWGTAS